jgi:hypothetical protein
MAPASRFGPHGTRAAKECESPGRSAARRVGRPGRGCRSRHLAVPRRAGRGRSGRGQGWRFGVRVPVGDPGGGGCAVVAGAPPGSGHRGHSGDPRNVACLDLGDGNPPQGHTRDCRIRADRRRHLRCLCGERSGEARSGRGASLPCGGRGRRSHRGVPRARRLVIPQQPRHSGRRSGCRSCRAAAPSRLDHAARGRGRRAAARAGGGSLPARRARRRDARRRCRGGGAARVPARCPGGGITAGKAEAE